MKVFAVILGNDSADFESPAQTAWMRRIQMSNGAVFMITLG